MSKLIFSPNLFLGVQEWNIFQNNIHNSINRNMLINTRKFGIVKQLNIPEIGHVDLSTSFYVSKSGTPFDEVIINEGVAIDSEGNFIINPEKKNIKVPADGNWYNIIISYNYTNKEKGKISVDSQGVVTGTGTEFTKCLRGYGEFNSKVRFLNTKLGNSADYEVAKIINDSTMILVGDFSAESDLDFGVYGTFLDGYQVPAQDEMILRYDSFKCELVQDASSERNPDIEFIIARVINNGIDVTVEDYRTDWWKTEAMSEISDLTRFGENPILGIDSIKYDVPTSPRDENIVTLSWNFKCTSYTIDTNSKKISILIGEGGIYKDTSYFQVGDFNGWRVYSANGSYSNIIDSQKTGTQIVLTLDTLYPPDFNGIGKIIICPPYEGIEFKSKGAVGTKAEAVNIFSHFNIQEEYGLISLKTVEEITLYNIQYRYKTYNDYTPWKDFKKDSVGYYDETSFKENGNLKDNIFDRKRVPYNPEIDINFVKLLENPESYIKTIVKLDVGDLVGVNKTEFKAEKPVIDLYVGKDKQYQHFSKDINSIFKLQGDVVIVLHTKQENGGKLRDGNSFIIHIAQFLELGNFSFKIVQNYNDTTSFTDLYKMTENDVAYIKNSISRKNNYPDCGLFIRATWSEEFNQWILNYETDYEVKGTLKTLSTSAFPDGIDNYFSGGLGSRAPYFGWKLANNYSEKFLRVNNSNTLNEGGADEITLNIEQMPRHNHALNDPGHSHKIGSSEGWSSSGNIGMVKRRDEYDTTKSKTGITIDEAGGGQPFDNRPKFREAILIEKYV